jgi:hypothetical protein
MLFIAGHSKKVCTTDKPGPILELLTGFRSFHDEFLDDIRKVIPGFEPEQFSLARSPNMNFYIEKYKSTLNKVLI